MSTLVFGIEIELNDAASQVTEDTDIGLYNGSDWDLESNAVTNDTYILLVGDATDDLYVGNQIYITDDDGDPNEIVTIKAIVYSSGRTRVDLTTPLVNSYDTANSAFVRGNSRFRWVQNSVTSLTGWNSTMIVEGGIDNIVRECELPGLALPGSCGVTVTNTGRFHNSLFTKGIYLNGRQFRVYKFTDTTPTIIWTGWCEQPEWTTESYYIGAIGGSIKHKANILTVINPTDYPNADAQILGKCVPATFGKFVSEIDSNGDVVYDSLAKFVRTANAKTLYDNSGFGPTLTPNPTDVFPVTAPTAAQTAPSLVYTVGFGYQTADNALTTWPNFYGKYLVAVDGEGEDQARLITNTAYTNTSAPYFEWYVASGSLEVGNYFKGNLVGNTNAVETDQTWVRVQEINREYQADAWPCYSYLDNDGVSSATANPFAFLNATDENVYNYVAIPPQAYSLNGSDTNTLEIDLQYTDGDPDKVNAFFVYQVQNPAWCSFPKLSPWLDADEDGDLFYKKTNGVYEINPSPFSWVIETGTVDLVTDRTYSESSSGSANITYAEARSEITNVAVAIAMEFDLPDFDSRISFDNAYIGVMTKTFLSERSGSQTHYTKVRYRKWLGYAEEAGSVSQDYLYVDSWTDTIPDFYWIPENDTKNRNFYTDTAYVRPDGDRYDGVGYETFTIAASDADELNQIDRCAVILYHLKNGTHRIFGLVLDQIFQIMVTLRKSLDVKDAVYAPFVGRTYNSTWGTRKSADNPINGIVDILEHVCRLQCWSECSAMPTNGWGKGYAEGARVNVGTAYVVGSAASGQADVTVASGAGPNFRPNQYVRIFDGSASEYNIILSVDGDVLTMANNLANTYGSSGTAYVDTDGSFDSYNLTALVAQTAGRICHQVQDYEDGWTDKLKQSICRDYSLLSWCDKYGFECVKQIRKSDEDTQDTVTLADIVDRSRVRVTEPEPSQLYAEPLIRYQIDYGDGDTQKTIAIRGAGASSYDASYVDGLDPILAEEYWDRCQTIWGYSRELSEPPTWWSDLTWVNGENADELAKDILSQRIDWMMNPRIEIPLHFNKAGLWEEGHTFTLTLPHQTAGTAIKCIVSRVNVNLNAPYDVLVTAYMWRETIPEDYDIIDTMTIYGTDRDWLDNTTEYGDDSDKIDNT